MKRAARCSMVAMSAAASDAMARAQRLPLVPD
jgi:hypothetical protein